MKWSESCTYFALILQLFFAFSTSQVVLFNQNGETEEDSISHLLELEGLMPQDESQNSPTTSKPLSDLSRTNDNQNDDFSNLSKYLNNQFKMDAPNILLPSSSSSDSSSSSSSSSLSSFSSNIEKMKARTAKDSEFKKEEQKRRQELDAWLTDELFYPDEGDPDELPLFRSKRQTGTLVAGSGETLRRGSITLSGDLTPAQATAGSAENISLRQAIAEAIRLFLTGLFPNGQFQVQVVSVRSGSIVCEIDIAYLHDFVTLVQLAQGFQLLDEADNLKAGSQIYTVSLPTLDNDVGTTRPTICYLCQSFQSCVQNTITSQYFCQTVDSRYFSFGPNVGDGTLPKDVESANAEIVISSGFPWGGEIVNKAYVTVNGLISVGTLFTGFTPTPLPVGNLKLLAPYWTDLDLISSDLSSNVYYQLYERSSATQAQIAIFTKANNMVVTYDPQVSAYAATHVIVVTWENLPPWPAASNLAEKVNFQVAIITNGFTTYIIYTYATGGMKFSASANRNVVVGYANVNVGNLASYYVLDTIIGNTNTPGLWIWKIGTANNNRILCASWLQANIPLLNTINFLNAVIPPCPCSQRVAIRSGLWRPSVQPNCYDILPIMRQFGRRCCYWPDGSGNFENRIPLAGSLQLFTPYWGDFVNHQRWDVEPKGYCCASSNMDLCPLYYLLRPIGRCFIRRTRRGFVFGDPHVKTIDGREYTFNGIGEYTLMNIVGARLDSRPSGEISLTNLNGTAGDAVSQTTTNVNFKLQARTCRALNSDGNLTDATNWCAVAGRDTNGTNFRVSIAPTDSYMEIYINDEDYSQRFRDDPNFFALNNGVTLQRTNDSLSIFTLDDVGLTIKLGATGQLLDFDFEVNEVYKGMTVGLLGNFNDDNTDEFNFPNGTKLADSASDAEIFKFGQSWAITQEESVFTYSSGKNTNTYSDPSFVPLFLDEADPAARQEAENVCGGSNDLACIFDFIATKNRELALGTKEGLADFQTNQELSLNAAPVINTTDAELNTTVGVASTFTLVASDPEDQSVNYVVVEAPGDGQFTYQNTSGQFIGTITPNSLSPITVSIAAKDSKGLQSEVQVITIRNCNNCSNNGRCDYSTPQSTDNVYYSVATCICDVGYEGNSCENDKDGCAINPCPTGTTCSDVVASNEGTLGYSYTCSECPAGLALTENNTKCEDINECENNACATNSICTNTWGSFFCTCNTGYRKSSNGQHTCVDIDECVENNHECAQLCNNTVGSYTCYCETGFESSGLMGRNCTKVQATDPCKELNNTCSYGCRNSSGTAECFCQSGYIVNGSSCDDIDECKEKLCSQKCDNIQGSYTCSCYNGFILDNDKHGCNICPENQYGAECAKRCECRGRATRCDNVKGCQCVTGWTGEFCTVDVDECLTPNLCPPEQTCTNTDGSYTCSCPTGYEDKYNNGSCQDINECDTPTVHKCPQECQNNPGSFTCYCQTGYQYNSLTNTCDNIDECLSATSGCEQICVDKIGSYNCECNTGFVLGLNRKSCVKAEEVCANYPVQCEFACTVINDQPICICALGFFLGTDNATCVDIDECDNSNNQCSDNCINFAGSYSCSCPEGKQLKSDKRTCRECDEYHWGLECANECGCNPLGFQECNKVSGCVCKQGWGGSTCFNDENECNKNTTVCAVNSDCINTPGSYLCKCKSGFQLNATNDCEDIDECLSNPCDQICTNSIGSYSCSCASGFITNGDKCDDIDECLQPELNICNQICRNTLGSLACECENGFYLNTSSPLRNECIRDPDADKCVNASDTCESCIRQNGENICFCGPGFKLSSDNSSCINIDECLESPCKGVGAQCQDIPGGFTCNCAIDGYKLDDDKLTCSECSDGSFGKDCVSSCTCDTDPTKTKLCNKTNGDCVCFPGYNGGTCNADIDECNTVSCGPNSFCKNSPGSYSCRCNLGYFSTGGTCQSCDFDNYGEDCASMCTCVMANTKDCSDTDGTCSCKTGWTGDNCDKDIDECSAITKYCPGDNEICSNLDGTAECNCALGYTKINGTCENDNECVVPGGNNCTFPEVCLDNPGSFTCICATGYSLQNGVCTDINECDTNSNYCTGANEECNNLIGSAECICVQGYTTINGTCTDNDECTAGTDNCVFPQVCSNTGGSYECLCAEGYSNSSGSCRADSDSTDWKIGLGVGIPLFVILCVAIAVGVWLYMRKKDKGTAHSTPSLDRDAPFRSVFATQVATKGSWGAPARLGMYSPDTFSEAGTSDSGNDGQLLKTRQKVRSDFQDSPWFTNQGATPRGTPRGPPTNGNGSHGAPTESGAPTSNFSWEYMFRLLEPHKGFEIQRPNLSAAPNPAFSPTSDRRHPDPTT